MSGEKAKDWINSAMKLLWYARMQKYSPNARCLRRAQLNGDEIIGKEMSYPGLNPVQLRLKTS